MTCTIVSRATSDAVVSSDHDTNRKIPKDAEGKLHQVNNIDQLSSVNTELSVLITS